MYHHIRFVADLQVELEKPAGHPPGRMAIRKGLHVRAEVRPYAAETEDGPAEVADLIFANGTAARRVPLASFAFVEQGGRGGGLQPEDQG